MDLWRVSGVGGLQVPGFVLNSSFLPDTEQPQNPPAAPVWNILPSFPIWFYLSHCRWDRLGCPVPPTVLTQMIYNTEDEAEAG